MLRMDDDNADAKEKLQNVRIFYAVSATRKRCHSGNNSRSIRVSTAARLNIDWRTYLSAAYIIMVHSML